MKTINEINTTTAEGKLLHAAIAKISTESQKDKTSEEILSQLITLSEFMFSNTVPGVNQMPMIMDWPTSSMIARTQYDPEERTMIVTFKNGKRYMYYDLPDTEWRDLLEAESIGKYINAKIKGHYRSESMDETAKPSRIANPEAGL